MRMKETRGDRKGTGASLGTVGKGVGGWCQETDPTPKFSFRSETGAIEQGETAKKKEKKKRKMYDDRTFFITLKVICWGGRGRGGKDQESAAGGGRTGREKDGCDWAWGHLCFIPLSAEGKRGEGKKGVFGEDLGSPSKSRELTKKSALGLL